VVKTRTLATGLVSGGHVRLNNTRISRPSHSVRPGDVLTLGLRGRVVVLRIEAIGDRRGPAPEAAALYTDLSPPAPPRDLRPPIQREPGTGRPTKRDRRRLEAWKDGFGAPDDAEI
jgi:ribosome-associated heat shock protein Hsp15